VKLALAIQHPHVHHDALTGLSAEARIRVRIPPMIARQARSARSKQRQPEMQHLAVPHRDETQTTGLWQLVVVAALVAGQQKVHGPRRAWLGSLLACGVHHPVHAGLEG